MNDGLPSARGPKSSPAALLFFILFLSGQEAELVRTEEGLPEKIPQWHQLRKATSFHVEKHEGRAVAFFSELEANARVFLLAKFLKLPPGWRPSPSGAGDNIQEYEPDSPDESGEFASPLGYQARGSARARRMKRGRAKRTASFSWGIRRLSSAAVREGGDLPGARKVAPCL